MIGPSVMKEFNLTKFWLKIFEICALGKLSNAAQTKWKPRRGVSLDEVRHKIIVLK